MKLCNIAAVDPFHQNRGVKGLKGYSHKDKLIWDEFNNNWEDLVIESEEELEELLETNTNILDKKALRDDEKKEDIDINNILEITKQKKTTKIRKGQFFFRKTILSSYNNRCCITNNPIPLLLVASHILPWAKYPEHRLNPKNGLCLAKTHDVAFDRELINFDENYKLIISNYLQSFLPNETLEINFIAYQDQEMKLPDKFKPDDNFLLFHRENIFLR